jgi:hypothetical protein
MVAISPTTHEVYDAFSTVIDGDTSTVVFA